MVTGEYFFSLVKREFYFLENEFQFSIESTIINNRQFIINYTKHELLVRVLYSLTNNYLDIIIYNHISKVPPGQYDWRYSVTLGHLMKRKIFEFEFKKDYEVFMPKNIPLEESIIQCAKLFKKFASPILENKEWVSWGEIVGYNQYVPPNLP